jgi:predicted amidophosphoribosyltransferase
MRALLDLAAPIRCLACDDESDAELCARCAGRITAVRRPFCERCGTPGRGPCVACRELEGFVRARSVVVFAEPARSLTLALKRRGRGALARDVGSLVAGLVRAEGLAGDVVTYVPAGARADRRGFDPARLLAKATARELGRPVRKLLVRVADGPRQADVPLNERRANVRGRFAARPITGSVLLVDDVFTTGATAEACAIALRDAGADHVDVVTWARTLRRLYFP